MAPPTGGFVIEFRCTQGRKWKVDFKETMALQGVYLASDVYLVCLTHALSTEKEEIMGLLIGDVSDA